MIFQTKWNIYMYYHKVIIQCFHFGLTTAIFLKSLVTLRDLWEFSDFLQKKYMFFLSNITKQENINIKPKSNLKTILALATYM